MRVSLDPWGCALAQTAGGSLCAAVGKSHLPKSRTEVPSGCNSVIAALLPVKVFSSSKQRLAGFLTPHERALLARTMFEDVFAALREAQAMRQGLDRLLVVSAEPYVLSRCRQESIAVLEEREQLSHSNSVKLATRWASRLGATSLLSVPIDTPAVTPREILSLLRAHRKFPVVVVPSADGSGTNALLRTPPDVIDPRFGPGSCRLHVQAAEAKGLPCSVFHSTGPMSNGLLNDIDTPEDLAHFLSLDRPCRTTELARQFLRADRETAACL